MCSLDKLERVSALLQWLMEKALCWHLPFRVLTAGEITSAAQGTQNSIFTVLPSASDAWRGIYGSRFPKSWLKGWDQPRGGPAKETCNPSGKLGSPFSVFYHLILWRAVQLAIMAPRGNITISFNSLSITWYCSVCPRVICVMFLNLHLSWGSCRHFLRCIAAIIWPAIAICVSVVVYSQNNSSPACCEC